MSLIYKSKRHLPANAKLNNPSEKTLIWIILIIANQLFLAKIKNQTLFQHKVINRFACTYKYIYKYIYICTHKKSEHLNHHFYVF